jgi:hypothetical protein
LQLFANSDIGNLTKDKEQCPPKDYLEAVWGACPPLQCERPRGFDFRKFCSTKVHIPAAYQHDVRRGRQPSRLQPYAHCTSWPYHLGDWLLVRALLQQLSAWCCCFCLWLLQALTSYSRPHAAVIVVAASNASYICCIAPLQDDKEDRSMNRRPLQQPAK